MRTPLFARIVPYFGAVLIACEISAQTAATPPPANAGASPAWQRLDQYSLGYAYSGTQLRDHVYRRATAHFAQGDAARDALKSPAEVTERQAAIRKFMTESLGGLPSSSTPLNARITGTVPGNGFTIEKIVFESRPKHYVTANLYLPTNRSGRSAAVLFVCGHHNTAKQVAEYQSVCQTLVQAGLIVLAQDPIGQGERLSYFNLETKIATIRAGTGEHDYAGAQTRFVGDQIARYFLHDSMRSIDYLLTRPEVDPARIGVTGNSGGGTQTSLMMLADPRVAAAAPATFIMSRETYMWTGQPQDAEQNWFGFTAAGFDHEDILLAMAPKPVCVLAVTSDFFPIEGTRRTVTRSRRIWDLYPRGSAVELVEDDSTHSYTPTLARAAASFFSRHLLHREINPAGIKPEPMPEEKLHVLKSGQVRGDLPDAEFVYEANVARLATVESQRRQLAPGESRNRAVQWLREQIFRAREAGDLNPRRIERGSKVDDLTVDIVFWWSQPRLANLGMLFRQPGQSGKAPITIALWDDGSNAITRHASWIREECARGRAVLVLNLSGMGPMKPAPVNSRAETTSATFRKLVDDLSFLGDSLVALRTYEMLRTLDVLPSLPDIATNDIRIHAEGRIGVHAKLAAALDARISRCEWKEGFRFSDFVRQRDYDANDIKSIMLPGALKYFDLDEL